MPITFSNTSGIGNFTLVNTSNSGRFTMSASASTPPPSSGSVYTQINTIMPYLRANSGSLRNPNFFTYYLDSGTAYSITDGGNDMFDDRKHGL